jgi:hypothetical protein
MISTSHAQKHFHSAHTRFFDAAIHRFFKKHLPGFMGNELLNIITVKLIELIQQYAFETTRIKPGQMLWVAVDKNTRADSMKVQYKPIVLTLVNTDEIGTLEQGKSSLPNMTSNTIARLCTEAFEQGALLSMRDIGLILKRESGHVCSLRRKFEKIHNIQLPTPAVIQDMGSGVTHKAVILRKILIEKKEMSQVRAETLHTQQAIDRYLKDYRRVELLLKERKDLVYIGQITQMSLYLIKQHQAIYNEIHANK